MALTPEEVVNQKFTITKFRDGYDLDQVDDFLDTIVEELRQHEQEKTELQSQLDAANERIAQLEAGSGAGAAVAAPADDQRVQQLQAQLDEANSQLEDARKQLAAAPSVAEQTIVVDAKPAETPKPATDSAAVKSSAMLQLALELHDKYVTEGETQRDEMVKKAETTAAQLVGEAETERANVLRKLEGERKDLADRISDLRDFESEYRNTLTSYIQSQLRELEGSPEPKGAPQGLN